MLEVQGSVKEKQQKERISSKSACLDSLQLYIHDFFCSLKQSHGAGILTVLFDI